VSAYIALYIFAGDWHVSIELKQMPDAFNKQMMRHAFSSMPLPLSVFQQSADP
jgi:hypothetical protein